MKWEIFLSSEDCWDQQCDWLTYHFNIWTTLEYFKNKLPWGLRQMISKRWQSFYDPHLLRMGKPQKFWSSSFLWIGIFMGLMLLPLMTLTKILLVAMKTRRTLLFFALPDATSKILCSVRNITTEFRILQTWKKNTTGQIRLSYSESISTPT